MKMRQVELRLEITAPTMAGMGGAARAAGRVRTVFEIDGANVLEGPWVQLESPLDRNDLDELKWYLESQPTWSKPYVVERVAKMEASLLGWGETLFHATIGHAEQAPVYTAYRAACIERLKRDCVISVIVGDDNIDAGEADANQAASILWSLPWELLADADGYIALGSPGVSIRRSLRNMQSSAAYQVKQPLRVLLVIARPVGEGIPFMDPRASSVPLARALEVLGDGFELTLLPNGTFQALEEALEAAEAEGRTYSVVHFDGHGTYDTRENRGVLYFESAAELIHTKGPVQWPPPDPIDAQYVGLRLSHYQLDLFFLEACQSATGQGSITSSVAAQLHMSVGCAVVAMGHAIRIDSSQAFVAAFYEALASGESLGSAVVCGRNALQSREAEPHLREETGYGLRDWFLPTLFQCGQDCGLVQDRKPLHKIPPWHYATRLGALPSVPPSGLWGRWREILFIERFFHKMHMLAIWGGAGQGKTMIAVAVAHWLIALKRFDKIVYASLGRHTDAESAAWTMVLQLIASDGARISADPWEILQHELSKQRILLILDDIQDILPLPNDSPSLEAGDMFGRLKQISLIEQTRILLVSRAFISNKLGPILHYEPYHDDAEMTNELATRSIRTALGRQFQLQDAPISLRQFIKDIGWNARSLAWLAPIAAKYALAGEWVDARECVIELERLQQGNPHRSVLTLARLNSGRLQRFIRRPLCRLGVFRRAAHFTPLAHVMQVNIEESRFWCLWLVDLGLAIREADDCIIVEPGFMTALWLAMSSEERTIAEQLWVECIEKLIYELAAGQSEHDTPQVHRLANLYYSDIDAYCDALMTEVQFGRVEVDRALDVLHKIQFFAHPLHMNALLERVVSIRQPLMQNASDEITHLRAEFQQIESAADADDRDEVIDRAKALVKRLESLPRNSRTAELLGDTYHVLGNVHQVDGRPREALEAAEWAQAAIEGYPDLDYMRGRILVVIGNALCAMGRLDDALSVLSQAEQMADAHGDRHGVIVAIAQRANVLTTYEGRLHEALELYQKAYEVSKATGWAGNAAKALHEIARLHMKFEQYEQAEQALRECIAWTERSGEANTGVFIAELAWLYSLQNRHEEALAMYRRALLESDFLRLFERRGLHHNIGMALLRAGRLGEARTAFYKAARISERVRGGIEPWLTWLQIYDVEQQLGDVDATTHARKRVFSVYMNYRREGGLPAEGTPHFIEYVGKTLEKNPQAARAMRQKLEVTDDSPDRGYERIIDALFNNELDPESLNLVDDHRFEVLMAVEIVLAAERGRRHRM